MNARWPSRGGLLLALLFAAGCSDLGTPLKPEPHASVSVTGLDFGTVALSQSSTRSVTLSNSGTGTLTGTISLSCTEYTLESGAGSYSLAAGETKTIVVRFAPNAVGSFACELDLGPQAAPIPIVGSAALQNPGARCIVLQDSIGFGATRVGQSVNRAFELLNAGTAPLLVNVVSSSPDFEVISGGGSGQIAPGSSINVIVVFHPAAGGRTNAKLELGPACPEIGLSGTGFTLSYSNDVLPIFVANCSSCHEFGLPQYYDTYYYLVTVYLQSPQGRIKAYDLDDSWLYQRIIGNPIWGDRMPQGGVLPDSDIAKIRQWILEGAQNN